MRYIIREHFFHLGEDSEITDDQGSTVYQVDGKVFSLHNRLVVRDAAGHEVARVQRRLMALRPTYEISSNGEDVAEIRKKFFTPFHDEFTIDVPGPDDLEMDGDILSHEYVIRRGGQTVATVSKRWIALTETYGVEIAPGENDTLILASVLALDLAKDLERDRTHHM
jgi:uncharacterized protein YxjI